MYKCFHCKNMFLCEQCYLNHGNNVESWHEEGHLFLKIRYPNRFAFQVHARE